MEKVKLLNFDIKGDYNGFLTAVESCISIPFEIKRLFYIFDTKKGVVRGQHANLNSQFVLVSIKGDCKVLADNGSEKETFILDRPYKGLFLEKLVWKDMFDFSPDCILLVISDCVYDSSEYIRNYDDFLLIVSPKK